MTTKPFTRTRPMKVGIFDDGFYILQSELLRNHHSVYVAVAGLNNKVDPDEFAVCEQTGDLTQCTSRAELTNIGCDLYILGTDDSAAFEYFESLRLSDDPRIKSDVTVLGHASSATLLEHDREFAFSVNTNLGLNKLGLINPKQHTMLDQDAAAAYLRKRKTACVVKQHHTSPLDIIRNRTVIVRKGDHETVARIIESKNPSNPWFNAQGHGGIVVEDFHEGIEMSFGAWFDGSRFVGDYYVYEEHKGAWNGGRGSILTGEVGTTMTWFEFDETTIVGRVLRALEKQLSGKCRGMIDLNTILDPKRGILTFIEYTIRWGRPTLEMWLAAHRFAGVDAAEVFYYGPERFEKELAVLRGRPLVGVTVFDYGTPLLEEGPNFSLFRMPVAGSERSLVFQFLSTFDRKTKLWKAFSGTRHFVSIGIASEAGHVASAIDAAYASLKGFNSYGQVWRDDVGYNTARLLSPAVRGKVF